MGNGSVFLLLLLGCALHPVTAFPEYRDELPSLPEVNGAEWPAVGHLARGGGGSQNAFGKDFAAAGYAWTAELCKKDSDKDGWTNGQELGDPDCKWRKGQPSPSSNSPHSISHPGLSTSIPQLIAQNPAQAHARTPAGNSSSSSSTKPAAPGEPAADAAVSSKGDSNAAAATAEPNADMPIPEGSETNLNGDKPQKWCDARQQQQQQGDNSSSSAVSSKAAVGSNLDWLNIPLPVMNVLGTPDMYSCHPFRIPDSIPDDREFTGVRIALDGASHLHHVLLMECPGHLWFLKDVTRNSEMCTTHSGSMFSACNRWWVSTEANNDYRMCTPPGLIYARAGEMRAANKVMVLQVHWVFGAKLQNHSVALSNASLHLMHEDPPAGPKTEIMETIAGTAVYGPSVLQHVNGLVIPGGQESHTVNYTCGRRCTYIPLGRMVPQPVRLAGYTFHGHHFMTGMRISIKRCPLMRMAGHQDLTWEVTDWLQSVVHPTYNLMGQDVRLYPGDQLSWSCTFNTSMVNRTVYGGYAGYSEEMCIMLLHYFPRNALLRGCMAVPPDQGGHSLCMYEAAAVLAMNSAEADRVPVRTMIGPQAVLPLTKGLEPGIGYKANVVVFWFLLIPAFLMAVSLLLSKCRCLGLLHRSYCSSSPAIQRNVCVYIMHLVLDTLVLCLWIDPLVSTWCGCTEALSAGRMVGFASLFVVVAYAIELVWRLRLNTLLLVHHVVTILVISILVGEMAAALYQVADAMLLLVVSALLEQPTFVALLLQRTLPVGSRHTLRAWRVAVVFWVVSKTLSVVLAGALMARDWGRMEAWMRGLYICVWTLIYAIQLWSAQVQYSIYRSCVRKAGLLQQLPPYGHFSSDGEQSGSRKGSRVGKDVDVVMQVAGSPGSGSDTNSEKDA